MYTRPMSRFDSFEEMERAQRRMEEKRVESPAAKGEKKVGYGLLGLICVVAGAGFSQVPSLAASALFFFNVLGIILGSIGVSRNDTKGCGITAIVIGSIFVLLYLFMGGAIALALAA